MISYHWNATGGIDDKQLYLIMFNNIKNFLHALVPSCLFLGGFSETTYHIDKEVLFCSLLLIVLPVSRFF